MEKLYTAHQVAEYLQYKYKTVIQLIYRKQLKAYKVGWQWRVKESDLKAFVDGDYGAGTPMQAKSKIGFDSAPTHIEDSE